MRADILPAMSARGRTLRRNHGTVSPRSGVLVANARASSSRPSIGSSNRTKASLSSLEGLCPLPHRQQRITFLSIFWTTRHQASKLAGDRS
jgi:hypothetical protein